MALVLGRSGGSSPCLIADLASAYLARDVEHQVLAVLWLRRPREVLLRSNERRGADRYVSEARATQGGVGCCDTCFYRHLDTTALSHLRNMPSNYSSIWIPSIAKRFFAVVSASSKYSLCSNKLPGTFFSVKDLGHVVTRVGNLCTFAFVLEPALQSLV